MKKRILITIALVVVILAFGACGKKKNDKLGVTTGGMIEEIQDNQDKGDTPLEEGNDFATDELDNIETEIQTETVENPSVDNQSVENQAEENHAEENTLTEDGAESTTTSEIEQPKKDTVEQPKKESTTSSKQNSKDKTTSTSAKPKTESMDSNKDKTTSTTKPHIDSTDKPKTEITEDKKKDTETAEKETTSDKEATTNKEATTDKEQKTDNNELAGDLSDILAKIYKQKPVGIMTFSNSIDLTNSDAVMYNTGLSDTSKIKEVLVSEAMMTSQAYSLVLVRVTDKEDTESVAKAMLEGINPAKWICVSGDDLQIVTQGDLIMLIMVSTQLSDSTTSQEMADALAKISGQKHELTLSK